MLPECGEIVRQGDENGNGMAVRFRFPSNLEIVGLATENFYGGDWDLGPTWNYVVLADRPFLVDSGRFGQGKKLMDMMDCIGIKPEDLEFVLISHGHEDHDGGLAQLVQFTGLKIKAHAIYDRLVRKVPGAAPAGYKRDFPAKCWHCFMPEAFYTKNCLEYHRVIQGLKVDQIGNGEQAIDTEICTYHLPGHSPDCLAVRIGAEAVVVGDIVLPEITPWPTREASFDDVAEVLKPEYREPERIFGLRRYLKSLMKLGEIAQQHPGLLALPAHRLYYKARWNGIELAARVNELVQHHLQRCGAILEILRSGPKSEDEIAREHFEERLLKGYGSLMAANEVLSHCELLMASGDVVAMDGGKYAATGTINFEEVQFPGRRPHGAAA
jgi:glyoxylase-like metal-dependent hydrolase (beta-lactamase superfamily II)